MDNTKYRIIPEYYKHPDFLAMPRERRVYVASFFERGGDISYVPNIPPSLLERLVKRPAQPGERIRIVNATGTCGLYKNGDSLTVDKRVTVIDYAVLVKEFFRIIYDREYLVIEPVPALHTYTAEQVREAREIICDIVCQCRSSVTVFHTSPGEPHGDYYTNSTQAVIDGKPGPLARCSRHDEYSREIGTMVALCRAAGHPLPAWL